MKIHCKYDALVPIHSLTEYNRNRNQHTPEQIERLSKLLDFYGVRAPVVVVQDSTTIAKGHGTVAAMKANGWTDVPVVYQAFQSAEELYGYVQSDNAIAAWAELDLKGINLDLGDLGPDFSIDLLGIENFTLDVSEKSDENDTERSQSDTCSKCGAQLVREDGVAWTQIKGEIGH